MARDRLSPLFFSGMPSRQFIDVGGKGDCGFRAVAAGLIDNALTHPNLRSDLLRQVLERHKGYFPGQGLNGMMTTSQIRSLISRMGISTLIQTLAYTLRQLAVDELCANPQEYPGAFVGQHEQTDPASMRQQTTWMDESSIAALAHALKIPITIQVVAHKRELPLSLYYNKSQEQSLTNPTVVIRLEAKHYTPGVYQAEIFEQSHQPHIAWMSDPVVNGPVHDPSLDSILAKIAADDERMDNVFNDVKRRLTSMVMACELTKDDLLKMYVAGMKTSDYLVGRVKVVTQESKHPDFFNAMTAAKKSQPVSKAPFIAEELIMTELIHAIARARSIGQLSEDEVFERSEQPQVRI